MSIFQAKGQVASNPENDEEETGLEVQESLPLPSLIGVRWVPDEDCDQCTQCSEKFTMVRRRHHCRNCGRIFCHKCSANSISLPELGYEKKVSRFIFLAKHDFKIEKIGIFTVEKFQQS